MEVSFQDQIGVLTANLASHEQNLKSFAATLAQLHEQLQGTISVLEWDRARLAGLHATVEDQSVMTTEPATAQDLDTTASEEIAVIAATGTNVAAISETAEQIAGIAGDAGCTPAAEVASTATNEAAIEVAPSVAPAADEPLTQIMITDAVEAPVEAPAPASLSAALAIEQAESQPTDQEAAAEPVRMDLATLELAAYAQSPEATAPEPMVEPQAADQPAQPTIDANVIDLVARRRTWTRTLARTATVAASMMMFATGSVFYGDTLSTEIGSHISRLATCNMAAIATNRNCAALAWLSL